MSYHWSYREGVPGDGGVGGGRRRRPGADDRSGPTPGRSPTGEMEPSVAFMRGRLKATGDGGLLLGLLASTATDSYRGGASG